jgi:hypothetical protein
VERIRDVVTGNPNVADASIVCDITHILAAAPPPDRRLAEPGWENFANGRIVSGAEDAPARYGENRPARAEWRGVAGSPGRVGGLGDGIDQAPVSKDGTRCVTDITGGRGHRRAATGLSTGQPPSVLADSASSSSPALDLVLVTTAGLYRDESQGYYVRSILEDNVLPAVRDPAQ